MAWTRLLKAASDFTTVISHRGWPDWEIFCPLANLAWHKRMRSKAIAARKVYDDSSPPGKTLHRISPFFAKPRSNTAN